MPQKVTPSEPSEKYVFQLYVSGMSPRSLNAIENLEKICAAHIPDAYDLEIIDIYKNPELASEHGIIFSPSLVRQLPLPKRTVVGTLKDTDKVIRLLGINATK